VTEQDSARALAEAIRELDTYQPHERHSVSDARFRDAVRALVREVLR